LDVQEAEKADPNPPDVHDGHNHDGHDHDGHDHKH